MNHSFRQRLQRTIIALAGACILITAPGCATGGMSGRLYVRTGPPTAVVERRAPSPGPEFVWIAGDYRWNSRQYVWVAGHWERKPHARAVWVPGRWVHGSRGWYFVEGKWR